MLVPNHLANQSQLPLVHGLCTYYGTGKFKQGVSVVLRHHPLYILTCLLFAAALLVRVTRRLRQASTKSEGLDNPHRDGS